MKLNEMYGKEFIDYIFDGRRSFTRIELEPGFDTHRYHHELNLYLRDQDLIHRPLLLIDSRLLNFKAKGLHLPYLRVIGTSLKGSNLSKAVLKDSEFCDADLRGINLKETNIEYASFLGTDLRGARNLEEAIGLGSIDYFDLKITRKEAEILQRKLRLFDIKE